MKNKAPKNQLVAFRVTDSAYLLITNEAAKAGMTVADFAISNLREDSPIARIIRDDANEEARQQAQLNKQREELEAVIEASGKKLVGKIGEMFKGGKVKSFEELDEETKHEFFDLVGNPFLQTVLASIPLLQKESRVKQSVENPSKKRQASRKKTVVKSSE